MTGLLIYTALGIEARAVQRDLPPGADAVRVMRTGPGPGRAARAAALLPDHRALAVVGLAGALDDSLRPGDVLVANEVHYDGRVTPCPSASLLAGRLARAGLPVRTGPLVTVDHVVTGAERRRLARRGSCAVDMETGAFVAALTSASPGTGADAAGAPPGTLDGSGTGTGAGPPFAAVRVIVDTPDAPLLRPQTVRNGRAACRALARIGPVLMRWAAAAGPRRVLLAAPRSFCAGVERAIDVVELALERHGPPVYVRKEIVHNRHVVGELKRRGAVFVEELDEIPPGAVTVFSAHGVPPGVRDEAARRGLRVIDATCPLVSKVHAEARRFAARGSLVALIGHAGHEEVEGTLGEVADSAVLVESADDVAKLPTGRPIAYLMQTTLAVDEAAEVAAAIRRRFSDAEGPPKDDICYATTNRQRAVRAIAAEADLVLVVGSPNSSNSQRLVEVAGRHAAAYLVDDPGDIALEWLDGARTIGLTAGASAPPSLVDAVVTALRGLGPVTVEERRLAEEAVQFTLPKEVSS